MLNSFRHYKPPPFHTVIRIHLISLSYRIIAILPSHFSSMEQNNVNVTVYQSKFNEFLSQYDVYNRIFTDGSKSGEAVGSAAIVAFRLCKKRPPNNSSMFSAEARGIGYTIGTRHDTPVYRQSAPFLADSFLPAKSSKSRPLTPSYCRDFMSCACFNIRWFQFCFYVGSCSCWVGR